MYSKRKIINYEINRMNNLVVTDDLTGVFNRRYINERLPVDIDKALKKNDNERLTVALMDIDYFKNINDKYGHAAGDYVLKEIAKIISGTLCNSIDWIARYGGEEFIIVYNGIKCKDVNNTISGVRNLIEKNEFIYNENIIKVTASLEYAVLIVKIIILKKLWKRQTKTYMKLKKVVEI